MRRRGYFIFACILALLLVGCGHKEEVKETNKTGDIRTEEKAESSDTVEEESEKNETEPVVEENVETVQEPDKTANDLNAGTSTKPSSGSNTKSNTGATDSANNSNSTENASNNQNTIPNTGNTTQPVHEHTWVEVTEEKVHYYDWRNLCNVCKTDLTDMSSDDRIAHVAFVCGGSYAVYYIEVDFVTENVQTETIVTGYKCLCGEVKEN